MSATGRGATRRKGDRYYTPAWAVKRLLEGCPLWAGGLWLEPCVGGANIVRAVDECYSAWDLEPPTWRVCDLDPDAALAAAALEMIEHAAVGDYTRGAMDAEIRSARFSVCLTNPPYLQAMRFLTQALTQCDTVALLLRLNWLASEERQEWLAEHTPDVYVLPDRPSFTDDGGTDATDYAWMVWRNHIPGRVLGVPKIKILATTPAAERRAA